MRNPWNIAFVVFLVLLGTYVVVRATHPYRWSAFSFGDAYILQGGFNLAEDGFVNDRFLGRYTPGPKETAHDRTFYTHYPNIHTVVSGLLQKAGVSIDNRVPFKLVGIALSLSGLVLLYLVMGRLFADSVAFLGCFVTGVSPAFLLFVDSFTSPTYDFFFRNGFIACFLLYELSEGRRRWLFISALVFLFLQSLNSFDYIPFLQIVVWGFYFFNRPNFSWKKVIAFAAAPVLGLALHFGQVAWFFGSVHDAVSDFMAIFLARSSLEYQNAPDSGITNVGAYLAVISQQLRNKYGLGVGGLFATFLFVFLTEKGLRLSKQDNLRLSQFVLLNILGTLGWWVPFVGATANLSNYTVPYMSLSFIGPLIGAGTVAGASVLIKWRAVAQTLEGLVGCNRANPLKAQAAHCEDLPGRFRGITWSHRVLGSKGLRLGAWFLVLALAASTLTQSYAFANRSKRYIRKFPNEGDVGLFSGFPAPHQVHASLAQDVRSHSHYGDVILSDSNGGSLLNILSKGERDPERVGNPLYQYYSQREWLYFDVENASPDELLRELSRLTQRRAQKRGQHHGYRYFLVISSETQNRTLLDFLDSVFQSLPVGRDFVMYSLDNPTASGPAGKAMNGSALVTLPSGAVFHVAGTGSLPVWWTDSPQQPDKQKD